jgi:hypothetical protein
VNGLLVVGVGDGTQALAAGIQRGDIIIAYDGKPTADLAALREAVAGAGGRAQVTCTLRGAGGEAREVQLAPGTIGVSLKAIQKGSPVAPLPPDTGVSFALADLESTPLERWFAFSLDGEPKVGFEHMVLSVHDGLLRQRHEVAFDGGEAWGLNHQLVELEVAVGDPPQVRRAVYENALNGWRGENRIETAADGTATLHVTWPPVDGEPVTRQQTLPEDRPVIPTYLAPVLATRMPHTAGACVQYRPLQEGMGQLGLPCALVVVGPETLTRDNVETPTWKVEIRQLGGPTITTVWVDEAGDPIEIDYGGARVRRATREEALADLPQGLEPRTAD